MDLYGLFEQSRPDMTWPSRTVPSLSQCFKDLFDPARANPRALTFSRSVLHGSAGVGSFHGSVQELREAAGVVAVGVGTDQPGAAGGTTGGATGSAVGGATGGGGGDTATR